MTGKWWLLVAVLMVVVGSQPAHAVNRCVDEQGGVTYTDQPCPEGGESSRVRTNPNANITRAFTEGTGDSARDSSNVERGQEERSATQARRQADMECTQAMRRAAEGDMVDRRKGEAMVRVVTRCGSLQAVQAAKRSLRSLDMVDRTRSNLRGALDLCEISLQQGQPCEPFAGLPSNPQPPSPAPQQAHTPPDPPKTVINPHTGQVYTPAAGGVIDPNTGQFMPEAAGGYTHPDHGFVPAH